MDEDLPDLEPWLVASDLLITHPSPGMPSSQGFLGMQVANLEKLEASAQTLSMASDLGHEIRKMSLEQKRLDSRRSSVRSIRSRASYRLSQHTLSRQASIASSAHLSEDTYSAIRWPGFDSNDTESPAVTSIVSCQTSSWDQLPTLIGSSSAGTARHGQHQESNLRSPEQTRSSATSGSGDSDPSSKSPPLLASYQNSLVNTLRGRDQTSISFSGSSISQRILQVQNLDWPRRSTSLASTDTSKMRSAFEDFDGVHYSPVEDDLEEEDLLQGLGLVPAKLSQSAAELEKILEEKLDPVAPQETQEEVKQEHVPPAPAPAPVPRKWASPGPVEGLTYYPAPVPLRLNLPKRISKQPKGELEARRRTQVINHLVESRKSGIWQPQSSSPDHGQAQASRKLPSALRASAFFDEPSVAHAVEIKHGSAVDTLESMLDASAHAPVAHTYKPMQDSDLDAALRPSPLNRRSTLPVYLDTNKHRSSVMLLNTELPDVDKLSLGSDIGSDSAFEVDFGDKESAAGKDANARKTKFSPTPPETQRTVQTTPGEFGDKAEETSEDGGVKVPQQEPSVQPNTLLAALEARKQQIKSRTRTAGTSFPNGMYSTLLELDAVAQIEEKNRKAKRTTLAWEEDAQEDSNITSASDEDIPLAVLYHAENPHAHDTQETFADWGLMQRREFEDAEPLSSRRSRLLKALPPLPLYATDLRQDDDETLAQHTIRIKARKALDEAIAPAASARRSTASLSHDLLAFPRPRPHNSGNIAADAPKRVSTIRLIPGAVEEEGETLGQRRRRLHAEANAAIISRRSSAGDAQHQNQQQRAVSMANLLTMNPVSSSVDLQPYGFPQTQIYPAAAAGVGLLAQSAQTQEARKENLCAAAHRAGMTARYGLWPTQTQQQQQTFRIQPPAKGFGAPATVAQGSGYGRQGAYSGFAGLVTTQMRSPGGVPVAGVAAVVGGASMEDPAISRVQRGNIDRWRMSVQG